MRASALTQLSFRVENGMSKLATGERRHVLQRHRGASLGHATRRQLIVVLQKFGGAWRRCRFVFPPAPVSSLKGSQIVAVGKSAAGGRRPRNRTPKKSRDPEGVEQPSRQVCDPSRVELVSPPACSETTWRFFAWPCHPSAKTSLAEH